MTPRKGLVDYAQMVEAAAIHAFTDGREHAAYRLWKKAADQYRLLRDERGMTRCSVGASRAWRDLSGETLA